VRSLTVVLCAVLLLVTFCAKKGTVKPPGGDQLLWSSEAPRPQWAYEEVYASEGMQPFVGMSHKYADEKSCRDDAERDSRLRATRFLETAARETFERLSAELGLTGEVFNPSNAARAYAEMVSQAVIQNAKVVKFYVEQRKSAASGEVYYLSFAKLQVPDQNVKESFSAYTNRKKDEWKMAQEQIDRVNDAFYKYWDSKKAEQELKEPQK